MRFQPRGHIRTLLRDSKTRSLNEAVEVEIAGRFAGEHKADIPFEPGLLAELVRAIVKQRVVESRCRFERGGRLEEFDEKRALVCVAKLERIDLNAVIQEDCAALQEIARGRPTEEELVVIE